MKFYFEELKFLDFYCRRLDYLPTGFPFDSERCITTMKGDSDMGHHNAVWPFSSFIPHNNTCFHCYGWQMILIIFTSFFYFMRFTLVTSLTFLMLLSACDANLPSNSVSVTAPSISTGDATLTGAEKEKDMMSWTASTFSLSEVQKHASTSDCYTTVNGKVYNVTAFFGRHPGWDPNLSRVCGIDATDIFTNQHGWQQKPENILKSFYIGELSR